MRRGRRVLAIVVSHSARSFGVRALTIGGVACDAAHVANHHSAVVIWLVVAYTPKGGAAASITRSIRITS